MTDVPFRDWQSLFSEVRALRRSAVASVDHVDVVSHVADEGGLTVRFVVMVLLSCGIAILGLLLSSPAVIIGAMLISPLMGPIILFGFSLTILSQSLALRSLAAIAVGSVLAVGFAALIVWLSPLNAVTPEILARTRPNFFDLLVAIFSAIAGGYAVAMRKGETIVGVAIATALMPPLAVTGYGLAVGNWAIFAGAGGLFMSNLLAIALTASLIAKFFGFGAHNSPRHTLWQTLSIVAVFLVLSIPLGLSLERIATEAVVGTRARAALESLVKDEGGRIYEFSTTFPQDAPVHIEAMVLSRKRDPKLSEKARAALEKTFGQPVDLALAQVVAGSQSNFDQKALEELVAKSKEAIVRDMQPPQPNVAAELANETGLPPLNISVDDHARQAVLRAHVETVAELATLRGTEARLNALHPGWQVSIRPDALAFQPISFGEGSATLDAAAESDTADIIWALQRETIGSVEIVGYADLSGSRSANRRMALQRANAVAAKFAGSGIATRVRAEFPAPDQHAREMELGRAAFRQVRILPAR